MIKLVLLIAIAFALLTSEALPCGTELWSLKVLPDANAPTTFNPTIAHLTTLPAPNPHFSRTRLERNTYHIRATLVTYRQESDEDYRLALADDKGNTMIAEIPSPHCAPSQKLATIWRGQRAQLDNAFGGGGDTWTKVNAPVVLTGVLFFDRPHGHRNVAPNAVELHPLLGLKTEGRP